MISINDVKCEDLWNTETEEFVTTQTIRSKWNKMSFDERKVYETTLIKKTALYADEILEVIYSYIDEYLDEYDTEETIWDDSDSGFAKRLQSVLNEISDFHANVVSGYGEAIDPTIDLEEVEE